MMTVLVHTFTVYHRPLRDKQGEVVFAEVKTRTAAQAYRLFTAANPDRKVTRVERKAP